MSFLDRLRSDGFPRAVADGKFGKDKVRFLDLKIDGNAIAGEHFCSTIHFGDVVIETDKGHRFVQSVVIKALKNDEATGIPWLRLYNEYLFYTEILPLLKKCDSGGFASDMFPRFIFGRLASSNDSFMNEYLIFENAQKRGFKLCVSKLFMDYAHLELTYRKMAQFHALSLICKQKYPKEFKNVASKIQELIFLNDDTTGLGGIFQKNAEISLSTFNESPEYREKLFNVTAVIRNTNLSMSKVAVPIEPLTVICHADLHRNNIFFRYDLDTETPSDLMFFDFALTRQASPVFDLATPLFTNASPETRMNKWVQLFKVYHSTLTSCPDLDPQAVPSLNDLILDFKRRGFYGCIWGCSTLNCMLITQKKDDLETDMVDQTQKLSETEQILHDIDKNKEKGASFLKENMKFMIHEKFDFEYILNLELSF